MNMKPITTILLGIIFVLGLHFQAYGADPCKVAIVDFQMFQEKSTAAKKIMEAYQKKLEPQVKELKQEQAELLRLDEELRNQSMMLSLDAKEDRRNELEKKKRRFKYLENEYYQSVKQLQYDLLRRIGRDIKIIVTEIGKKEGYTMILEKKGVGFLYHDEKIDITDQVVQAFDTMNQ